MPPIIGGGGTENTGGTAGWVTGLNSVVQTIGGVFANVWQATRGGAAPAPSPSPVSSTQRNTTQAWQTALLVGAVAILGTVITIRVLNKVG